MDGWMNRLIGEWKGLKSLRPKYENYGLILNNMLSFLLVTILLSSLYSR